MVDSFHLSAINNAAYFLSTQCSHTNKVFYLALPGVSFFHRESHECLACTSLCTNSEAENGVSLNTHLFYPLFFPVSERLKTHILC